MSRFASISEVNPLRRALTSLAIQTTHRFRLAKHMRFIASRQALFSNIHETGKYSDELSYCYRPFDLSTPAALHEFVFYSDRDIGGQSTGSLLFDQQEKSLVLQGTLSDKDKEKLTQHPSIGMARAHSFPIHCGPFTAISIQVESDGLPMHLGVEVYSRISGLVSCYGIIASKIRGWRTYELPFVNMILVGGEDSQWNDGERELFSTSFRDGTRLGNQRIDMRRIIQTETDQVVLEDINLRLLGSKAAPRRVAIRNISLVHRAGTQRFIKDYLHPFFYMVDPDPYIPQREVGVSWLTKGYSNMDTIDLGDKRFVRKDGGKK